MEGLPPSHAGGMLAPEENTKCDPSSWPDPRTDTQTPVPRPAIPRTLSEPATALREKVRTHADDRPGVYRFSGPRGELLYVGKSVRIRSRLLSWLRSAPTGKSAELIRVAREVEWEYVPTEFEALLKEFRLIRAFRPRFNVHHRRERRFAWIKVTREPAPRLIATRRPTADGSAYLGPFPAGRGLPRTLGELSRLTGIRDCPAATPMRFSDQLDFLSVDHPPLCRRGEMGSCPAPCAERCTQAAYREGVGLALAFLRGDSDAPLERLEARMQGAASEREFEMAARFRDRAERLRELRKAVTEFGTFLESLNFVYRVPTSEGVWSYVLRNGRVVLQFLEADPEAGNSSELADRIRAAVTWPASAPAALEDSEREELFLTARWFRQHPDELARGIPVEAYLRTPFSG